VTIDSRMTLVLEQKPVSAQRVAGPASTLRALTALVELAQRRDCVGQLVAFLEFPDAQAPLGDCKAPVPGGVGSHSGRRAYSDRNGQLAGMFGSPI